MAALKIGYHIIYVCLYLSSNEYDCIFKKILNFFPIYLCSYVVYIMEAL